MRAPLTRLPLLLFSAAVLAAQPTGYLNSLFPGNGFVQYLSIPSYKPLGRTQLPPQAEATVFSPDGSVIYVLSLGNVNTYAASGPPTEYVSIINSATFAVISTITLPVGINYSRMAITPNGKKLYLAGMNYFPPNPGGSSLVSMNTASLAVSAAVQLGGGGLPALSASSDGTRMWIASGDLFAVDTATDSLVGDFPLAGQSISQVVVSPRGKAVYTLSHDFGGYNFYLELFNPANSQFTRTAQLPLLNDGLQYGAMTISHSGSTLYALGDVGGQFLTIDTATFTSTTLSAGGTDQLSALVVSPNGSHLYAAGGSTVHVLNSALSVVGSIAQPSSVSALAVNPANTQLLAIALATSTIQTFDAATLTTGGQAVLGYSPTPTIFPVLSADGKTIYSANGLTINFIDSKTMKVSGKFTSGFPVIALAITRDGSSLFATTASLVVPWSCGIQEIDTATRTAVKSIAAPCNLNMNLAVSSDGRWLYGPGSTAGLGIYDVKAGLTLAASFPNIDGRLSLSRDGKTLYAAFPYTSTVINTVDTASLTASAPISISGGAIIVVAPSAAADVAYVVTSDANSVTVVDTARNVVIGPLAAGLSDVLNAGFTPDGSHAWLVTREGSLVEIQTSTGLGTGQSTFPAVQPAGILFLP